MKVTALAPWFGSNRMLAEKVGIELAGCDWVGVPFAGGMSELVYIKARTMNVNDLHKHIINLARVLADPIDGAEVYRALRRIPFHPDSLIEAQGRLRQQGDDSRPNMVAWAVDYFVAAWMPRHGSSGTSGEFRAKQSIRWNANGGDSAKHYWSAVESIQHWRRILRRANFTALPAQEFLAKCKDDLKHGIYCDPPFPGPGDGYTHKMSTQDHRDLAWRLGEFQLSRIVCRFYDVPLIRELYPEPRWTWRHLEGRKQTNEASPEVLLLSAPAAVAS